MTGGIRPFGVRRVPAPTGEEAAAFDRFAIDRLSVPDPVLMENAGRAAAHLARWIAPGARIVGLVGPGNNGGDAIVALRTLRAWGCEVGALALGDPSRHAPRTHGWPLDTRDAESLSDAEVGETLAGADLLLDGLLGTGTRGAPRPPHARLIEAANRSGCPVLALDLPSGVDADTGVVEGAAIQALCTIAFGGPKRGTLFGEGRMRAGRLVAVEIGFPPVEVASAGADSPEPPRIEVSLITPAWAEAHAPVRSPDAHKTAVGTLLLLGGGVGMAGAVILGARAALRAGVGLLRVATAEANRAVVQEAVPEAVWVDPGDLDSIGPALERSDAVAAGPGLGREPWAEETLARVLDGGTPLVLDADGLNLVAERGGGPSGLPDLGGLARRRPTLVTPHLGEMARLTGRSTDELGRDPASTALRYAEEWGTPVLLKGLPSVVAAPGRSAWIDTVGTSDLASAGMGDVLTGVCGAFLATGLAPAHAGALALHRTGRAAALARTGPGLLPSDLIEAIPEALLERGPGESDLPLAGLLFDRDPVR